MARTFLSTVWAKYKTGDVEGAVEGGKDVRETAEKSKGSRPPACLVISRIITEEIKSEFP